MKSRDRENNSIYGASSLDPNIPSVQRHKVKVASTDDEELKNSKKKADKKKKS